MHALLKIGTVESALLHANPLSKMRSVKGCGFPAGECLMSKTASDGGDSKGSSRKFSGP